MDSTPPLATETITYGWSIDARKWFHSARPRALASKPENRAKCGRWIDKSSTERHHVPAHLKPCPRCFRQNVPTSTEGGI